jgi:hypothetical protein
MNMITREPERHCTITLSLSLAVSDITVIRRWIIQGFQNATHLLNLKVLPVDDVSANCIHDTQWIFIVGQIIALNLARMEQRFCHVDGILVVRNHLMIEQCNLTFGRNACRHALEHEAAT